MNNELKKRILSSIVLVPIVFFLIIKGSYFFLLLLLISIIVSLYEWHFLAKNKSYYVLGFVFLFFHFIVFIKLDLMRLIHMIVF